MKNLHFYLLIALLGFGCGRVDYKNSRGFIEQLFECCCNNNRSQDDERLNQIPNNNNTNSNYDDDNDNNTDTESNNIKIRFKIVNTGEQYSIYVSENTTPISFAEIIINQIKQKNIPYNINRDTIITLKNGGYILYERSIDLAITYEIKSSSQELNDNDLINISFY